MSTKEEFPMKKKTLCGILTTAMLFGICPANAMAEDAELATLTNPLDFRNVDVDMEDPEMGWKWKASSQKLTLENFRVVVPSGHMESEAVFYLPDESKVDIEGKNNMIKTESYGCDVFYSEGELKISSDGKIEISTGSLSSNVIYAHRGPVIIDEEVEMTVEPLKGRLVYVDNAKGRDPIFSIQDEAKIIFLKEDGEDDSIYITHKSSVAPADNWLDYAEAEDEWDDDYVNLVAAAAVKAEKPETEEKPADPPAAAPPSAEEEPAAKSEYQITIGNAAIKKDGYVTYISDAKPYLSHGYTMLPLRALLNVTNADAGVMWDAVTKTVTVRKNSDTQYTKMAYIVIGEKEFVTAEGNIGLSTPTELKDGRAFVSLRDWMNILAALDMPASNLNWDAKTKTVTFTK